MRCLLGGGWSVLRVPMMLLLLLLLVRAPGLGIGPSLGAARRATAEREFQRGGRGRLRAPARGDATRGEGGRSSPLVGRMWGCSPSWSSTQLQGIEDEPLAPRGNRLPAPLPRGSCRAPTGRAVGGTCAAGGPVGRRVAWQTEQRSTDNGRSVKRATSHAHGEAGRTAWRWACVGR